MTNASRAKRKRAAVRSAKRSRHNNWWYGLTAIVVIAGIALVVYARATAPAPVGPFIADPNNPTKQNTHWHAALGVYDCDHWMSDGGAGGAGTWNWPAATGTGSPARTYNTSVYAGLHSHDDGVIHMEPATSDEAGKNATVGQYFNFGGWKISATGYSFLGTTVKNGDKCGSSTGTLQWETGKWDGNTAANAPQQYTVKTGNPGRYKLFQDDIVVIAFLPQGKSIQSIGNPPSVPNLAKALGAEGGVGVSATPTTMPATPTTMPAVTVPTTAGPASSTPTTAPSTATTKPQP